MNWKICALLSAFFAALTAIFGKLGVKEVNSNLATAVRVTVILFFAWGLVFCSGAAGQLRQWPGRTWLFMVLSGVATGLSWLFYFHALKLEQASKVAPVDKLSVPMTILLAALLLGESLTWQTVLGGLLVLAGSLVLLL
ncbi:MAG: EamA family transporter [Oligosphaeraceae bacterium]